MDCPVLTPLISILSSSLPCGVAVGPSRLCQGRLGLWWVGRSLEAGTLLGKEGDTDWTWTPELNTNTDYTEDEKTGMGINQKKEVFGGRSFWISFACKAQRRRQKNVEQQCACAEVCVGECVYVCLRVCQDIQPGSELLMYEDTAASPGHTATDDEGNQSKRQEQEGSVVLNVRETDERRIKDRTEGEQHQWSRKTELLDQMGADGAERAPDGSTVRCSSRLAAKPRRVHRPSSRSRNASVPSDETSSKKSPDLQTSSAAALQDRPEVRERRYSCSVCIKSFYQMSHLKKHQFSHSEEKPFTCEECGRSYTSAESFRAHQMNHRGERPFGCPHCEKSYGLKRDLKEHMILHTGEKPYVCDGCGKAFARRPSLRIHRLLHCSKMAQWRSPKIKCTVCSKMLANSGSLSSHMKLHSGVKPHTCQHCGKSFAQKGNLESHARLHSGERPLACGECDQSFAQKAALQRHMFSHTGGGFLCSYCGKSLRDPHSLKSHERLHTGERPHCCSVCGKGYILATKLRRHMKSSHLKEKPYSCHCGASYSVRQSLQRHQAQHAAGGGATEEAEAGVVHQRPIRGRPKKATPPREATRRRSPSPPSTAYVRGEELSEAMPAEMEEVVEVVEVVIS